jgi:hypothetical protein
VGVRAIHVTVRGRAAHVGANCERITPVRGAADAEIARPEISVGRKQVQFGLPEARTLVHHVDGAADGTLTVENRGGSLEDFHALQIERVLWAIGVVRGADVEAVIAEP